MANINKIQLPNGTQYDIEDAIAREKVFIITLTSSEDEQTGEMVWSADKTYAQISAACTAGKVCIAYVSTRTDENFDNINDLAYLDFIDPQRIEFSNDFVKIHISSANEIDVINLIRWENISVTSTYLPDSNKEIYTLDTSFQDLQEKYIAGYRLYLFGCPLNYYQQPMIEDSGYLVGQFVFLPEQGDTYSEYGAIIEYNPNTENTTVRKFPKRIHLYNAYDSESDTSLPNTYEIDGFYIGSELELGFKYFNSLLLSYSFDYESYDYFSASLDITSDGTTTTYHLSFIDPATGVTKILTTTDESLRWTLTEVSGGEQSDWEEDDTTDMAYVLNRPAIRAGTGENSVIIGGTESDAATYTLYLTGAAGDTFTYTTEDTLPSASNITTYGILKFVDQTKYLYIKEIDTTNQTITISSSQNSALANKETVLYFKYKIADGTGSVSEGKCTVSGGNQAHSEGGCCLALGSYSHAEGSVTRASGQYSHSEGRKTESSGLGSHSEGINSVSLGNFSHTEGTYTIAQRLDQHVFGAYNIADTGGITVSQKGNYIEIVGNGTAEDSRSNARTLDWSGNEVLAGKLTVGTGPINAMDVATKQYVDQNAGGCDPSDATPLADGVASAGSSNYYARGDHVHPKITQTISMSNNIITLTGSDGTTSSVTLPVYNGSVSTGGSSS